MHLSKKDLELLIKMENLIGYNEKILFGEDKSFVYEEDKISHDDFLDFMSLIENLIIKRDETNKKVWESIKAKRETDKNYARSKKN